ncbi:opticin [Erinaceus europaeus]|uniref:Opticin n=1 Tax=Erinaceus europaeus TaxID=9365 RepID=A0ABM3WDF9_ERIEU|nr:opticin [Erinaceus europaeus]
MRFPALLSLLALVVQEAGAPSPQKLERKRREEQGFWKGSSYLLLHMGDYILSLDSYEENMDLSSSEELPEYEDRESKVKVTSLAPTSRVTSTWGTEASRTPSPNPTGTRPTETRLPTCLVCVCLASTVYCDDAELDSVPPLPQTTTYLYARFNRISHIRVEDFTGLTKLKRLDLSSNSISSIDDDALCQLHALQDLILPENQLAALPILPSGIRVLDVRMNQLQSSGIQAGAFQELEELQFLYLADNLLESIPGPLPLSLRVLYLQNNRIKAVHADAFCHPEEHRHTRQQLEDIRLDGNPVHLGLYPDAYFCLPRLPTGRFS